MEAVVSRSISLGNADNWLTPRRKVIDWSTSWLPSLTLLAHDLLSWPAIFLLLSQLRLTFLGSPGQLQWHLFVIPGIFSCVALHTVGAYDRRSKMLTLSYAVEHLLGIFIAFFFTAFILYGLLTFGDLVKPSRIIFAADFSVYAALTLIIRRWLSHTLHAHHSQRNFVLIAERETATGFNEAYRQHNMPQELWLYTDGQNAQPEAGSNPEAPPSRGGWQQAMAGLNQYSDGVIIGTPPSDLDPDLARFLAFLNFRRVPVYTLESFYELEWRQVAVENIEAWWAFARESLLARDSIYDHVKRLFDLISAAVALVILSPLLLVIALLIRIDSRGPAIFRQTRIGREEKPFTLFKFRSMRVSTDSGPIYTAKGDSRITRIGTFLRRTRLDEFPQLINVLKGDMSIIGPRAEWEKCTARYEGQIPFYGYRHLVRPGITGWAQVNYPYGESDGDALEKLRYDLYYIRNYSFTLDLTIALKTLQIMAFARGR